MTTRSSVATLLLAAASGAILLASCSSLTEPSVGAGVYILQSIGGKPVPVVVDSTEFGTGAIVSDTLTFFDESSGRRALHERIRFTGYPDVYDRRYPLLFDYGITGVRILIRFRCGYTTCSYGSDLVGTMEGDSIIRIESYHGDRIYRRQGPG